MNNQIDMDNLQLILQEFSKDLQDMGKGNGDVIAALNTLSERINQFEQKLEQPKSVTVKTDTRPIESIVKGGIAEVQKAVEAQPKNVIRKFQILLFPERDAKLFYKIVFGRWFMWLTVMLLIINLYKFGIHWSNNQTEIKVQQLENDRVRKAWNYLYKQQGKNVRRLMDSAYIKSFHGK